MILGSAEGAITGEFVEAANIYAGHPEAVQLRAMNIIYETTKERGDADLYADASAQRRNTAFSTLRYFGRDQASQGLVEVERRTGYCIHRRKWRGGHL